MRWSVVLLLLCAPMRASAQESALQAEFRGEGDRVSDACGTLSFTSVPGCAYTLFTDHPLHIAAGSMPPQSGFGFGAAFVWTKNTKNWRMSWDIDAVGATSAAWRVGAYMTLIHTPHPAINPITIIIPGQTSNGPGTPKPPAESSAWATTRHSSGSRYLE